MKTEGLEHCLCWHPAAGQAGYSGKLLQLSAALDAMFLDWANASGAYEWSFPAFLPAAELRRIDYLSSFPHLAMFPVAITKEPGRLHAFAQAQKETASIPLEHAAPVEQILTPAACYHVYVRLQGREYASPLYVTTRNTCFRSESEFSPLERQSAFSMREIVCIGNQEEVQSFLERQRERLEAIALELGLRVSFESANDPFFQPERNPKALVQRLAPSKTEMVFDGTLAVGSLNFHRNYFGEAFAMTRDGVPLYSGCVAFGVERWIAMIVRQFGPEPIAWPAPFRAIEARQGAIRTRGIGKGAQ